VNGVTGPTADWALRLLLRHGLINDADCVLSNPVVEETSMSHTSFCVRLAGQPKWYVKKADVRRTQGRDLGAEATAYQLAAFRPELQQVMPRCRLIGENGNAVVLEAAEGEPLSLRLAAGISGLPDGVLQATGGAVAQVHQVRCAPFGAPPWLLGALEPHWGGYGWLPPPAAVILSRLASLPLFRNEFRRAQAEWKVVCLVHGDIRWSNLLLAESDGNLAVKLVDWELACVGDPAWDLGGLLAETVTAEALSRPVPASAETLSTLCRAPLRGYFDGLQPDTRTWTALLERSVRLAGVRLVQTTVEYAHTGAAEAAKAEGVLMPWSNWLLTHTQAGAVDLGRGLEQQPTA
jgi:aminoglycoside phosphotransferase (APT) family kinase protein